VSGCRGRRYLELQLFEPSVLLSNFHQMLTFLFFKFVGVMGDDFDGGLESGTNGKSLEREINLRMFQFKPIPCFFQSDLVKIH